MSQPLISVIVPVYNVEAYLRECLDSIVNQTFKDIEIICIDDGSTDNSLKILQEYKEKDSRFTILTQKNLYAGVARNAGLKIAKGKYLSFLDSDDFFELTMLEDMYNTAEKDHSDIVVCEYRAYNNKTHSYTKVYRIDTNIIKKSPFNPSSLGKELFEFAGLNAWSKLFRKDLFDKYNIHFEECACCNDLTCVCTALALANKISALNRFYISYRMNQTNNITANRHNHTESFLFAIQQVENNLKQFGIYNKFKEAFIYKAKLAFAWEMSLCTPEQKEERKAYGKKSLSSELYNALYNDKPKPVYIPPKTKVKKNRFY